MSENPHSEKNRKVFALFLILVVFLSIKQSIDRSTPMPATWTLSNGHIGPVAFSQCDATDEYLYFSYSNSRTSVDVYDLDANYLYTLCFPDRNNGAVYIRSDQNKMYIKLRNDYVFVFQGKEELSFMTEEEADSKGYTNDWFQAADSRLVVDDSRLYLMDEQGQLIAELEKPKSVKEPFRIEVSESTNTVFKILSVAFMCFWFFVAFRKPK